MPELKPGPQKDALIRKIRQHDTAAHISEWLSSPGFNHQHQPKRSKAASVGGLFRSASGTFETCPPILECPFTGVDRKSPWPGQTDANGRVEMWRGGFRLHISVSASFVWRCLSGVTVTPFPHPAHRTGQAALPHPALGQDLTPSPTACRAHARLSVRARSARKGARVDKSRPCIA